MQNPDHGRPWAPEGSAGEGIGASLTSDEASEKARQALRAYREIPPSQRNWRRDPGFQFLSEGERHKELVDEAIRDTRALSETILRAVPNVERQRHLREILINVEFDLQKDQ